ncbi:hypothetical protein N7539_001799 [Penicillium diatomitis]|uniref:Amine oxidase domain-containing protein n=1 Tax=Penicillium diatomitis TaxID=2819901 RepID=A0A9W9XHF3_9EURO|nr:uncharacterized protein N7539_001799 [Penicillium diatomitis]KAJ5493053.1 hypothetical protein N7539_001799 [Penicillium diatomitis]
MSIKPRVGIIGAGLSGLRCADILVQNGAQVTILEARDRVGGRVHQGKVGGHLVDLGSNWIHGTGSNPITAIAAATKTVTHDPVGQNLMITRDGQVLDETLTAKASNFMWTTIAKAFEYSNQHSSVIPPERSLYDFIRDQLEQMDYSPQEKRVCLDACKLWGGYVGDPVGRQSLKFFRLEECIDSGEWLNCVNDCDWCWSIDLLFKQGNDFVASTYQRIVEYVSQAALSKADVRFNQPVVAIETPIREQMPDRSQPITVTTVSGDLYYFDELVVTCPLGWLKQNTAAFSPALPSLLLSAIQNITYGRLEKVFLTFPRAFWHDDSTNQTASSSSEASQSTATTATTTGTSTSTSPAMNPIFTQFLEPEYTNHPEGMEWNQECLSLAGLPSPCNQPTLMFYTYGPCSTYIVEQISPLDPRSPEYREKLITLFEPFYSRLPGFDASRPDCDPTGVLATQWQKDPYAGNGSYCNFQIGLTQADKDIVTLRTGAGVGPERGLWFAGEHTAPFVALGTTTGAYWSGERAAVQICEKLRLGNVGVAGCRDDSLPSAMSDKSP